MKSWPSFYRPVVKYTHRRFPNKKKGKVEMIGSPAKNVQILAIFLNF